MNKLFVVSGMVATVMWAVFVAAVVWMLFAPGVPAVFAADAKEVFATSCANCHGKAGRGDGAMSAALNPKPKDLTDKAYMKKLDDDYLMKIISKGGPAVGKSPLMPPFGGSLKEQEIKDVISYLKSLAN